MCSAVLGFENTSSLVDLLLSPHGSSPLYQVSPCTAVEYYLSFSCAEPRAQPAPGEQRAGEDGRAGEPPRIARPQPGRGCKKENILSGTFCHFWCLQSLPCPRNVSMVPSVVSRTRCGCCRRPGSAASLCSPSSCRGTWRGSSRGCGRSSGGCWPSAARGWTPDPRTRSPRPSRGSSPGLRARPRRRLEDPSQPRTGPSLKKAIRVMLRLH